MRVLNLQVNGDEVEVGARLVLFHDLAATSAQHKAHLVGAAQLLDGSRWLSGGRQPKCPAIP